jgi:hypothetical protein
VIAQPFGMLPTAGFTPQPAPPSVYDPALTLAQERPPASLFGLAPPGTIQPPPNVIAPPPPASSSLPPSLIMRLDGSSMLGVPALSVDFKSLQKGC